MSGEKEVEKIDLDKIKEEKPRCYFNSIDELYKCFFKRYTK